MVGCFFLERSGKTGQTIQYFYIPAKHHTAQFELQSILYHFRWWICEIRSCRYPRRAIECSAEVRTYGAAVFQDFIERRSEERRLHESSFAHGRDPQERTSSKLTYGNCSRLGFRDDSFRRH